MQMKFMIIYEKNIIKNKKGKNLPYWKMCNIIF